MIKQLIIDGKKSYDDFGVYIGTRKISEPKKKTIKESVPFSNVVYDFSKIDGEIYWEERTLEYSFDIAEFTTEEMEVVKSKLLDWLLNVHDTDIYDPYIGDYHFHGSFDSDSWSEDFGAGEIKVSFSVYPYKISNSDNSISTDEMGISSDGTLTNSVNGFVRELSIDGKSTQDGTPTPDTPVEIESVGYENLFDNMASSQTINGINFTVNNDGSITANGTATADANLPFTSSLTLSSGTYTISGTPKGGGYGIYHITSFNGEYYDSGNTSTFTISDDLTQVWYIQIFSGQTVSNLTFYPMLEKGTKQHSYVPYGKYGIEVETTNGTDTNTSLIVLDEPLRSLPNGVKDTYENGVVTRRVGETDVTIIDSTTLPNGNKTGVCIVSGKNQNNDISTNSILSSKAKVSDMFEENTCYENPANIVFIGNSTDTLETIKTKFEGGKILYELATPVIEEYELPSIPTYDEVTYISLSDETTFEVKYDELVTKTVINNSSHRVTPTITSTGSFNIKLNDVSYSVGEGTYNNTFYLETGENNLTLTGYGEITFSYVEEMF